MYNIFKNICEAFIANLVRNNDYLIASQPASENYDVVWFGESKKRFDETKYKLS